MTTVVLIRVKRKFHYFAFKPFPKEKVKKNDNLCIRGNSYFDSQLKIGPSGSRDK